MKEITVFLLTILIISCGINAKIQPNYITDTKDSIVSKYILPRQREQASIELKATNSYKISITVDHIEKQADAIQVFSYYNNSGNELTELFFHLYMNSPLSTPMKINSIEADGIPLQFTYRENRSLLEVQLDKKLAQNQQIDLRMDYTLNFTGDSELDSDLAQITNKGFTLSHFYPTVAVIANGEILTADSAWYVVEIETDENVVIVTTGVEVESHINQGRQRRIYIAGPVRDFFICGDESYIPSVTISGETDVISYAKSENNGNSTTAARIASSAISLFNSRFGIYPFNKLKLVALPMTAEGEVFPCLSVINETLYESFDENLLESTIVIETAHQWFSSLIGNDHIGEPWIEEGFTQYAMWLYYRERYGSSAALNIFNLFISRWEQIDRAKIPINKPVSFYSESEYEAIIYGRAPLFLIELSNLMGEEEFLKFIKHLTKSYSYKVIDTEIFRKELFQQRGTSMNALFSSYFDLKGE